MATSRVEKITKKSKYRDTRIIRVERRTVQVRKLSNFEILRDAFEKYGKITLRIYLSIKSERGAFDGFHGTTILIEAPSVEVAQEFPQKLRDAVAKVAEELGMKARRKDAPL